MLLFSPADLILLVIRESTCWKCRETKNSVQLRLFLQLLRSTSQDTVSCRGLHVSQNWPLVWIRKATCMCVHAPGCIFILHLLRSSWCLSHHTDHCKQQGSRKGLWNHLPTTASLQTMSQSSRWLLLPTSLQRPWLDPPWVVTEPSLFPVIVLPVEKGLARQITFIKIGEATRSIILLHLLSSSLEATWRQAPTSPHDPTGRLHLSGADGRFVK